MCWPAFSALRSRFNHSDTPPRCHMRWSWWRLLGVGTGLSLGVPTNMGLLLVLFVCVVLVSWVRAARSEDGSARNVGGLWSAGLGTQLVCVLSSICISIGACSSLLSVSGVRVVRPAFAAFLTMSIHSSMWKARGGGYVCVWWRVMSERIWSIS